MHAISPVLLVLTVAAVGILHTLVPDHWAPIALLARQQGWDVRAAARSAALAGIGHTVSTLVIAVLVWIAGTAIARQFGGALTAVSSAALVAFGAFMAISALREIRAAGHSHAHHGHLHWHAHELVVHRHWHEHHDGDWHVVHGALALAPQPRTGVPPHVHGHPRRSLRTALVLVLGSSPMVEGIPAFLAAARYGAAQLTIMSAVFAVSTIATYVALVVLSLRGLERVSLGRFERYGEVVSGALVTLVGIVFFFVSR